MSNLDSFATLKEVANETFDYIICGGGTAGLTLAARLSENPAITVLVLDAGHANLDDPVILVPGQSGRQLFNDRYDWNFLTTPQKHANNKSFPWSRGKSLGGSSAMNFLCYSRPPVEDIDAWERIGNPGWNWSNHLKYIKRGEKFTPPTAEQTLTLKQTYDAECHGTEGTLQVGFYNRLWEGQVPFHETMNNAGIPTVKEPLGGHVNGTFMTASTFDPIMKTRSYAVTAFYSPYKNRRNLKVMMEAHVNKIIFASAAEGDMHTAEGVELSCEGITCIVKAGREVILSAGAIKSPQILELSGVGDAAILGPLGIACVVPLPGVGSNVQEHIAFGSSFELHPPKDEGWNTLDVLKDPEVAAAQMKLFETQQGLFSTGLTGFTFAPLQTTSLRAKELISALSQKLEQDHQDGLIGEALWEQYQIQIAVLRNEDAVDLEIMMAPMFATRSTPPEPEKSYMTVLAAVNHPFSRGTIHIASPDPQQQPLCDPHYLENDFDMQLLVEGFKFVRKLKEVEPFQSMIVAEIDPGVKVQTDEEIREHIIRELTTAYHTAGSCSMLPREKAGVVDHTLKVYGTSNVRVVDLSIVPLHFAAHAQASVYGIAEQAADIILGRI